MHLIANVSVWGTARRAPRTRNAMRKDYKCRGEAFGLVSTYYLDHSWRFPENGEKNGRTIEPYWISGQTRRRPSQNPYLRAAMKNATDTANAKRIESFSAIPNVDELRKPCRRDSFGGTGGY